MPLAGEVLAEPVEHRLVRLGCRVGVVARAGVVEEGVIDAWEDPDLVHQAGGFERRCERSPATR